MYIRPERKRKSSPLRVLILVLLIIGGVYVLTERKDLLESFGPTPTPTVTAAYYVGQGDDLYSQGRYDQAIAAYQQAVEQDPKQAMAYARASRLLAFRGHHREAVRHANLGVEAGPTSVEARAALCMALDWNGQYDEAILTCLEAVDMNPDYANSYAYLAEAYADKAVWSKAIEMAEKAVALDEQSVDA